MSTKLALVLVASFVSSRSADAQNHWYVDGSVSGPGTGTEADPFPTIPAALQNPALVELDVIRVRPGVYAEPIVIDVPVVLEATDGPTETVVTGTQSPFISVSQGIFANLVEVNGFHLRGSGTETAITGHFARIGAYRCIFSDLGTGIENFFGDMWVTQCDVTRCELGLLGEGSHVSYLFRSALWDNTQDFEGVLLPIQEFDNLFEDPLNIGPDDFRRTAASPAIDAGPVGANAPLDPDGTPVDLGALWYDVNQPLGETFCFNGANSTGDMGRLRAEGTTSLSAISAGADLTLHVDRCPAGVFGIFLWGTEVAETPITAGRLCVGGNIVRLAVAQTNSLGAAQHTVPRILLNRLDPGDVRPLQFWHRDVAAPGIALTGAALLTFGS